MSGTKVTWEVNELYDRGVELLGTDSGAAAPLLQAALALQPDRPRIHVNLGWVGALLAGGCVVATDEAVDDVELEAIESAYPPPPTGVRFVGHRAGATWPSPSSAKPSAA